MALLDFQAIGHFIYFLVQNHLFERVCVICHELHFNIAKLNERVKRTWLLVERVVPENGELVSKLLVLVTC